MKHPAWCGIKTYCLIAIRKRQYVLIPQSLCCYEDGYFSRESFYCISATATAKQMGSWVQSFHKSWLCVRLTSCRSVSHENGVPVRKPYSPYVLATAKTSVHTSFRRPLCAVCKSELLPTLAVPIRKRQSQTGYITARTIYHIRTFNDYGIYGNGKGICQIR